MNAPARVRDPDRRFRRSGLLSLAAVAVLGCANLFAPLSGASASKPNLIIILADDMGYGDSSAYGGWIKTPHLERLALEGLRFTDFHASGNVCSPTRAGLLTGRYQQRAGISGVVLADEKNPVHFAGLQSSEVTLPELLRQAGYATALIGKWHLGYYPRYNPARHGFDEFRGYLSGNVDYQSHQDNQGRDDWWNGLQLQPESGYTTHLITRHADDFIRRHRDTPFFLYIAEEAVHEPYQGPNDPPLRVVGGRRGAAFADEASAEEPASRSDGQGRATRRPIKEIYRDMMTEMDQSVATVIATLKETGLADHTLVLFFSDNGATNRGSNGPLRGFKGTDWEGGHREPAIAWWPGHIKPGVTDQLASSLDVMPTFLELAEVPAPAERRLDGTSLKSLLLEEKPLGPRQLFWNGAMRDGPWKLMVQSDHAQLFNLAEDMAEKKDLSVQHPDRVRTMRAAWERWKKDVATDATPQPATADAVK